MLQDDFKELRSVQDEETKWQFSCSLFILGVDLIYKLTTEVYHGLSFSSVAVFLLSVG